MHHKSCRVSFNGSEQPQVIISTFTSPLPVCDNHNQDLPTGPMTVQGQMQYSSAFQFRKLSTETQVTPLGARGYNRRNQDGPIGTEVLWNAIRRMRDFALAWEAFQPKSKHTH